MASRAGDLIPVVQRSYEQVNRFPRAQRGLLGRVVIDDALRLWRCRTSETSASG
jgi:hypothetical protein